MQLRSSGISTMLQGPPEIVGPLKRQADVCCRAGIQWHVKSLHKSIGPACEYRSCTFAFIEAYDSLGRRRM